MDNRSAWASVIWNYFSRKVHKTIKREVESKRWISSAARTILDGDKLSSRVRGYFKKIGPAVSGQKGHNKTFTVACFLVEGLGLSIDQALPWMREYSASCNPPWTEDELWHKLEGADQVATDRGRLLREGADWKKYRAPDGTESISGECLFGDCWVSLDPVSHLAESIKKAAEETKGAWEKLIDGLPDQEPATEDEVTEQSYTSAHHVCPNPVCIMQKSINFPLGRLVFVPCRKWSCPGCRAAKKRHVADTVKARIDQYKKQFPDCPPRPLWSALVPLTQIEKVKKAIRRKRGNYFWVAHQAAGKSQGYHVQLVSTFPAGVQKWQIGEPDLHAEKLVAEVDQVSESASCRFFGSSRPWKLLQDHKKKDQEFKNVCRLHVGPERASDILAAHGASTSDSEIPSRWWPGFAWTWNTSGIDEDWLMNDLTTGTITREISDQEAIEAVSGQVKAQEDQEIVEPPTIMFGGVLV